MSLSKSENSFTQTYFDELLLNSGQYALFYVLMNISSSGINYFQNIGHTFLLVFLSLQTFLLTKYGSNIKVRFLGSMIAPICYSIFESIEGLDFILKSSHFFFWIFSILTASLQCISLNSKLIKLKQTYDFILTIINVSIFLFIYFYFDTELHYLKLLEKGSINKTQFKEALEFYNLKDDFLNFLKDPTHIYILLGGSLLALSIAKGRTKIIELKDHINELFGKYVDKKIRDELISNKKERRSESKKTCIIFADVRNFTKLTESHSADEIVKTINCYFSTWDKIISKRNGVIDKFVGDAIMVIFGLDDEKTACERAVESTFEFLEELQNLNNFLLNNTLPEIKKIAVGISFGNTIVGDIGSQNRLNYTAIGDSVNVASRIEGLCKTYVQDIIISNSVYKEISENKKKMFSCLGDIRIRGKENSVRLWGYKGDKNEIKS